MADARHTSLVPGKLTPPSLSLTRYRSPYPTGVIREALASCTEPGDLVLEVAGSGSGAIHETLALHRRILSLNLNPIPLLWSAVELEPAPLKEVQKALTHLGDLPKAGAPLISHINELYASRCPRCRQRSPALWFAWDRETGKPFAKRIRCPRCNMTYEGPVDEQDLQAAGAYPAGDTPAFHIALSRAVGSHEALRPHATDLIRLYTSRNLSALMDILYRLPQVTASATARRALTTLILEALDLGSTLCPYRAARPAINQEYYDQDMQDVEKEMDSENLPRPHSLRSPSRFLEHNIWYLLEKSLSVYRQLYDPHPMSVGLPADSLHDLLAQPVQLSPPTRDYLLLNRSVQSLNRADLNGAVQAIIVHLASPDAIFWSLSALWSAWLWGEETPAPLRTWMRRRRLDAGWYRQGLATALGHLKPLLRPDGVVLMVTPDNDVDLVRAAVAATNKTGSTIENWIACPPRGYRLAVRWRADGSAGKPATPADQSTNAGERLAADHARRTLSARGEPTQRATVTAAAIITDRRPDIPEVDPDDAPGLQWVGDGQLWLSPGLPARENAAEPLADRIEQAIVDYLQRNSPCSLEALMADIYTHFSGAQSPEPVLVETCIAAYARQDASGQVTLRPEDVPRRRRAEIQAIRTQVKELGERLGYHTSQRLNGDVLWREGRERRYRFRILTTAQLSPNRLKTRPGEERRCLLLPGRRATLVALKLHRDPSLQAIVEQQRWTFMKYRHLRRMVNEVKSRDDIEVYLGLDPIVEQQQAQIPLPLDFRNRG